MPPHPPPFGIRHSAFIIGLLFSLAVSAPALARPAVPSEYNVVWTGPSTDSLDSMPLSGSRGAGANVWLQDGSLWLYLAHNGAYDSQGRLLKLGCLRLTPPGGGFDNTSVRQELDLARGRILVSGRTPSGVTVSATLWFAGENLYIESPDRLPGVWEIHYATWRDIPRQALKLDMWATHDVPADTIASSSNSLVWFQRNSDHAPLLPRRAAVQGLPADVAFDPASRRIFGGSFAAAGGLTFVASEPATWQDWPGGRRWTYHTAPRTPLILAVALRAAENLDPATWPAEARALLDRSTRSASRRAEAARWKAFWSRSSIVINPDRGPADPAWQVGRNQTLFRYMLACNQGGEFPLLFNGGIFTTDNPAGRIKGNNNDELQVRPGSPLTPDFRRWMFCGFMSQNQRWLAWPALAAGDADLVEPSIRFYRDRAPLAAARAKRNQAEGVIYTEPLDIWGLCATGDRPDGLCGHPHLTYHFAMMLEHALIALHTRTYSGADLAPDLDWMIGTLRFYDSFYRAQHKQRHGSELNSAGRLVIYPGSAVEAVTGATNPIDAVSGLLAVSDALLALPDSVLSAERRATVAAIRATLPDLPVGEREGRRSLLIADSYEKDYNAWEFPEMYAAWPYRRVGVTVPGTLELTRATLDTIQKPWADKVLHHDFSWMPNIVNAASAGLPDRAAALLLDKMSDRKAQVRFPAFFGPGHDWLPDHNHGGSGTTGLQETLLQADAAGEKLHLLPAWPRDWDVEFKLHAPRQTTIELTYRDGKIQRLKVTPASRRADVILP